jgi:hypothetical protein
MTENSPIIGDLLEEYREGVLPERGRVRATIWFARQLASLVRPWMWGALLGFTLGAANLIGTALWPLAEDTPLLMLTLLTIVLGSLTLIGATAARQRQRISAGILGGAMAALVAAVFVSTANHLRISIYLDVLQHRDDWVGLMQRFHASGQTDLRAFVSHEYWSGEVRGLLGSMTVGAICGAIGAISSGRRARPSRARA